MTTWPFRANLPPLWRKRRLAPRTEIQGRSILGSVEARKAIAVTKNGRFLARIVHTNAQAHLSALIEVGSLQAPKGPRHLPTAPATLQGQGKSAADYVSEGRR